MGEEGVSVSPVVRCTHPRLCLSSCDLLVVLGATASRTAHADLIVPVLTTRIAIVLLLIVVVAMAAEICECSEGAGQGK